MTVGELLEKLNGQPQEAPIILDFGDSDPQPLTNVAVLTSYKWDEDQDKWVEKKRIIFLP